LPLESAVPLSRLVSYRPLARVAGAVALALTAPSAAIAQDAAPPAADGSGSMGAPPVPLTNGQLDPSALFGGGGGLTAALGLGALDGDFYAQSSLMYDFELGPVGLGLQLPLNVMLWDVDGNATTRANDTYFGLVRKADYPELTADTYGQYLRMMRYVRFGHKRDPLFVQYGQLFAASIGHGTLVNRYNNVLDRTRPRSGLQFDINVPEWGGIETLVNDISWPSTTLMAARGYVLPFGRSGIWPLNKWAVGVSAVYDRDMPRTLGTGVDAAGRPAVAVADPLMQNYGVDTEVELVGTSILNVVPYIDFNFQDAGRSGLWEANKGLHLGTNANFVLPIFGAMKLWTRLEWRVMQEGYIPDYFDAGYDLQRYQFPVGTELLPKAAAAARMATQNGNPWRGGYYGEASAQFLGLVQAGAFYAQAIDVANSGNLTVFATLPSFDMFKLSAYYLRKNFDKFEQLWALDERSVLTATGLVKLGPTPFWLMASFNRSWAVDPTGALLPQDSWNFGVQTRL